MAFKRGAEPPGLDGLTALLMARVEEKGLDACYLLTGDDRREIDAALEALEGVAVPADLRAFNSVRLRGLDHSVEDVVLGCSTFPMLGDRRFVLVREPERLDGDPARLAEYAKDPSPTACLVLVPAQLDRRLSWVKALEATCVVVRFQPPTARDLDAWIKRTLRASDLDVEPDALALLRDLVDTQTLLLANELEKLALSCAGRQVVKVADVEAILGRTRAIESFALTNAIEDADPQAAVAALRRLLDQGASVPMLVGMLDWCLGRLLGSEEPRTFPARAPALLRRRSALRGRGAELYGLLREADRLVRTTGANAEGALERAVCAAASRSATSSPLNLSGAGDV